MQGLKAFLKSKKAKMALVGILAVLLKTLVGLDDVSVEQITNLVLVYLLAQGGVDGVLAFKGAKTE